MELKNIQNIIHDNMMSYAQYVITDRALPDIRDGMKPVYRRILFTMNKMNATNFTKSANVSGQVMKVHPHGDTYPTIVGMVQKDTNITPFITGKGSFGQHTSRELQPAAARYTEIKLSEISKDMFKDIDKEIVKFIPNYDGTIMMPEVLPVKFPAVLHYAQSGIAVGMSSTLPSFNLKEINDATINYIKTGKHTLLVPDFATGGEVIINNEAFKQINERGTGTIRLRAKAHIVGNEIIIEEIPYTTTREAIIDAIVKLVKAKKLPEISNVQDLTGIDGMKIEITAKRNTDMKILLAKLYKMTPMECTFSANMNVLVNKLPRVCGTNKIIEKWVEWRRECVRKGVRFDLERLKEKLHRLSGLEKILLDIDRCVEIIRKSKEEDIDNNLQKEFNIDSIQADYISNIKLRSLNKDLIIKQISEIEALRKEEKELEEILKDEKKVDNIIIKDLEEITKKYGQPRRTQLVENVKVEIPKEVIEKVVENKNKPQTYKIVLTKSGYLKKLPEDCTEYKMKEEDTIEEEIIGNENTEILVFTGTDAYKVYTATLPMQTKDEFGIYLPTQLNIQNILGYGIVSDEYKYMLIVYDNMKVAKINIGAYKTSSRRTKLENSLCSEANPIIIKAIKDDVDLLVKYKKKERIVNTSAISSKNTRYAKGNIVRFDSISIK